MQSDNYQEIEARDSELWWLAVVVILLLAVAVLCIDTSPSTGYWLISPQLELALNAKTVRVGLVLATLLICAYFRDSARRLRQHNRGLVSRLADHTKQLEKKNQEISRLKELSDQLIGMTDMKTALDLVLEMAVEVVHADSASIMLRGKGEDTLEIVASKGLSAEVVASTRVRVGEAIAGKVVEQGKAVILNTDDLDDEMASRAKRADTIVSSVVIPIPVSGEIRGVVSTAKRRGGECFSDEDLRVLSALVNQASLVIEKTDLLDDLRNQVDALAAALSQLRQAQAKLMQSEKLASIGLLAGGVAHEINNPLQVILGRIELLLAQQHEPTVEKSLKTMMDHTSRIAAIVRNLLSFSRQNADGEFHCLDIDDVLEKTLGLVEPQMITQDVTVVREFRSDLPEIYGNASQLQQVFTNIILNAYQAMRQTGGKLVVRGIARADALVVEFEDTGPGIPPEHLDHILDPFFTTKDEGEGTGLGLAISYGILQSHGGNIEVESTVGKGSLFRVILPYESDAQNPTLPQTKRDERRQAA